MKLVRLEFTLLLLLLLVLVLLVLVLLLRSQLRARRSPLLGCALLPVYKCLLVVHTPIDNGSVIMQITECTTAWKVCDLVALVAARERMQLG